mgnify:CR=1 FL=1
MVKTCIIKATDMLKKIPIHRIGGLKNMINIDG